MQNYIWNYQLYWPSCPPQTSDLISKHWDFLDSPPPNLPKFLQIYLANYRLRKRRVDIWNPLCEKIKRKWPSNFNMVTSMSKFVAKHTRTHLKYASLNVHLYTELFLTYTPLPKGWTKKICVLYTSLSTLAMLGRMSMTFIKLSIYTGPCKI